jgi:hypothetical protein
MVEPLPAAARFASRRLVEETESAALLKADL